MPNELESMSKLVDFMDRKIKELETENAELTRRLATFVDMVEDVAIGRQLECLTCGKFKPCLCDNGSR